jgi:hydroxymethylpyrimidine pyrophosphatase-like HAD family hydrolase
MVDIQSVTSKKAATILAPVTHVYTDLDGTMLAPGGRLLADANGNPSVALAQRLIALKQAGIEVIIVTGRNRAQGTEIVRLLNLQTLIGELGTFTQDGYGANANGYYDLGDWDTVVLADGLLPGELPVGMTPAKMIEESGVIQRLVQAFDGHLEPHNPYGDSREVTRMFRGYVSPDAVLQVLAKEALPLQLSDNGIIRPQKHTLRDCPEIHVYHLMPAGTSKGRAVARDMQRRGISPKVTVSIGDAVGDVVMGVHTGSFVLVGNSTKSSVLETAALAHELPKKILATTGRTADGWVEFADALLSAKQR